MTILHTQHMHRVCHDELINCFTRTQHLHNAQSFITILVLYSTHCIHHGCRSEWKLPLGGRITYWHYRQPKLSNFLYSSNRLIGGGAADAATTALTSASVCWRYRSWPHWQWNRYGLRRPKQRNTSSWRLMRWANNNINHGCRCP